jgi:primosomal replication protein N
MDAVERWLFVGSAVTVVGFLAIMTWSLVH